MATVDVQRLQLRLSRRHLAALAAMSRDGRWPIGSDEVIAELIPRVVDEAGRLHQAAAPLAATAAGPVRALVTIARLGRERRIELRWGVAGLLVVPVGPDDGVVQQVAFQRPSSLARTLWRVLGLSPRQDRLHLCADMSIEELLEPFRSSSTPGWLSAVGLDVAEARMVRVDLDTVASGRIVSLVLVDTPRGLLDISASAAGCATHPIRPGEVFQVLAAWQALLTDAIRTA